jgi:hypothetical protein
VSYRAPYRVIDEYGYKVRALCQINTTMFGKPINNLSLKTDADDMIAYEQVPARTIPLTSMSAFWMRKKWTAYCAICALLLAAVAMTRRQPRWFCQLVLE